MAAVKLIHENGEAIYVIEGVDCQGKPARFGLTKSKLEKIRKRGSSVQIVQLLSIVAGGLVNVQHVFEGLKRPLRCNNNQKGDAEKQVFTWKQKKDFDWEHGKRFHEDGLKECEPPPGRVYVVSVTPNCEKDRFPSIDYWVDRWYWVREDPGLAGAPIGHENRYTKKLK